MTDKQLRSRFDKLCKLVGQARTKGKPITDEEIDEYNRLNAYFMQKVVGV